MLYMPKALRLRLILNINSQLQTLKFKAQDTRLKPYNSLEIVESPKDAFKQPLKQSLSARGSARRSFTALPALGRFKVQPPTGLRYYG